jgi:hypothetical protein
MEDREIGELWARFMRQPAPYAVEIALIRKLVNERAAHYVDNPDFYSRHDDGVFEIAHAEALREYNIDPATWKEYNEE